MPRGDGGGPSLTRLALRRANTRPPGGRTRAPHFLDQGLQLLHPIEMRLVGGDPVGRALAEIPLGVEDQAGPVIGLERVRPRLAVVGPDLLELPPCRAESGFGEGRSRGAPPGGAGATERAVRARPRIIPRRIPGRIMTASLSLSARDRRALGEDRRVRQCAGCHEEDASGGFAHRSRALARRAAARLCRHGHGLIRRSRAGGHRGRHGGAAVPAHEAGRHGAFAAAPEQEDPLAAGQEGTAGRRASTPTGWAAAASASIRSGRRPSTTPFATAPRCTRCGSLPGTPISAPPRSGWRAASPSAPPGTIGPDARGRGARLRNLVDVEFVAHNTSPRGSGPSGRDSTAGDRQANRASDSIGEQKLTPRRLVYWASWTGRPPPRQGARGRTGRAFLTPNRASLVSEGALTVLSAIQAFPAAEGENEAVPRGIVGIQRLRRLWGTGSPAALSGWMTQSWGKGIALLSGNGSGRTVRFPLPGPFRPRTSSVVPLDPEPQLDLHHLGLRRFRHRTPDLDLWEARKVRPIDGLEELPVAVGPIDDRPGLWGVP